MLGAVPTLAISATMISAPSPLLYEPLLKQLRLQQRGRQRWQEDGQNGDAQPTPANFSFPSQAASVRRLTVRLERKHRRVLPQRCRSLQNRDRREDRRSQRCLQILAQWSRP